MWKTVFFLIATICLISIINTVIVQAKIPWARLSKLKNNIGKTIDFGKKVTSVFKQSSNGISGKLQETGSQVIDSITKQQQTSIPGEKKKGTMDTIKELTIKHLPSGLKSVANMFMGSAGEPIEEQPTEPQVVIMEDPEAMKALQDGLTQMNASMTELENSIDEIKNYVLMLQQAFKKHKTNLEYEKNVAGPLRRVALAQQRLLSQFNKDHVNYFIADCQRGNDDPEFVIEWLHYRLTRDRVQPNLVYYISNNSKTREELMGWISSYTADAIKAASLRQACLGAARFSEDTIDQAIERMDKDINDIINVLEECHDTRVGELFESRSNAILSSVSGLPQESAKRIHDGLNDTFPFAHWSVLAANLNQFNVFLAKKSTGKWFFSQTTIQNLEYVIYIAWCTTETGPFAPTTSFSETLLKKAKLEMEELAQSCVGYAKRNMTLVDKFLSENSPAYSQSKNALLYTAKDDAQADGSNNNFITYGNDNKNPCSWRIDQACGKNFGVILTFP